jgi:hypothetical protein
MAHITGEGELAVSIHHCFQLAKKFARNIGFILAWTFDHDFGPRHPRRSRRCGLEPAG